MRYGPFNVSFLRVLEMVLQVVAMDSVIQLLSG